MKYERGLCKDHSLTLLVLDAIHHDGHCRLPGFEFPSKDESNAEANQSGLFRLLFYIISRVALQITQNARLCIARWLCCAVARLTFRIAFDAILRSCCCHCVTPSFWLCLESRVAIHQCLFVVVQNFPHPPKILSQFFL